MPKFVTSIVMMPSMRHALALVAVVWTIRRDSYKRQRIRRKGGRTVEEFWDYNSGDSFTSNHNGSLEILSSTDAVSMREETPELERFSATILKDN